MSLRAEILELPLLWAVAAIVVVGWTVWRGWWRSGALQHGPSRAIGLGTSDLLAGGGLMLIGMSVGTLVYAPTMNTTLSLRMLAMIGVQLLSVGLPAGYLVIRAMRQPHGLRRIGILPTHPRRDIDIGILGGVIALAVIPGVMVIVSIIGLLLGYPAPEEVGHELLMELRDSDSLTATALMMLSAVVIAPVLEEIVYRGWLQSMLIEALDEHRWIAVMLTGVVFATMHIGTAVPWQALPTLFIFGILLGWVYERTGSLLPSILIHAVFNAWNVGYVFFFVPPAHG